MRHLVLTGFMGAGKSSAATRLAKRLGRVAIDTDQLLEKRLGKSIEKFFAGHGEAEFRERERAIVIEALASAEPAVIALGGGALQDSKTRKALAPHLVVYLELEPEAAWQRVRGTRRPLARDEQEFHALFSKRRAHYEDTADAIVGNAPRGALRDALPWIRDLLQREPGPRMQWAGGKTWMYPALFDAGALARRDLWAMRRDAVTVTDEHLADLHPWLRDGIVVPPGETAKTMAQVESVCSQLAERRFERGRQLAAVGGGVVGDLAGFAAAIYQRGTPFAQVPTSLVAQVDSAYGGKTGVDLPAAKNYAGAYHQPDFVFADTEALATLPRAELVAGYAEVVKTALIAGGRLWKKVASGVDLSAPFDPWIVFECARTKLKVVAADERDADVRQTLNLGHTIGHAIETAAGYGVMRHGEAVAVGLAGALRISGDEALRARVVDVCAAAGLPVTVKGVKVDAVMAGIQLDKKRKGGSVPFVLVSAPGDVTHGHRVSEADVRAAVKELIA